MRSVQRMMTSGLRNGTMGIMGIRSSRNCGENILNEQKVKRSIAAVSEISDSCEIIDASAFPVQAPDSPRRTATRVNAAVSTIISVVAAAAQKGVHDVITLNAPKS